MVPVRPPGYAIGMTDLTAQTDKLLDDALARSGARDPREYYRGLLRDLKKADPERYAQAVAYYTQTLLPAVADGADPLECWTEYGRTLAEALSTGRTLAIDRSGRAAPFELPAEDRLVLHIPDDGGAKTLVVGLPPDLSDAQRATYQVLVAGKHK